MSRDRNGNPEGGNKSGASMWAVLLFLLLIGLMAAPGAVAVKAAKRGNVFVWSFIVVILIAIGFAVFTHH